MMIVRSIGVTNKDEVSSKRCYDVRHEMHCLFDGRQVGTLLVRDDY
jgi:hypothetical protein